MPHAQFVNLKNSEQTKVEGVKSKMNQQAAQPTMFQARWATPQKTCVICKEQQPAKDFVRYRGRFSNQVCNECWNADREKVLDVFMISDAPTPEHARVASNFLLALANRRFLKRGGIEGMTTDAYAAKLAKLPDRIAAILGKTYEVLGDAFELSDDQALLRIRNLLDEIDPTLVDRNKNKRLSR